MTLRPAQPADASSIAVLSIGVWTSTYLRDGVSPFFADFILDEFTVPKTKALIDDPTQNIWISCQGDGIDGVVRLSSNSDADHGGDSNWEIFTLYVQPRHHGNGIGKRLLKTAFHHARAQGARSVWLTTNAQNAPAIAFYLAQGFEQVGETHFWIGDEGYLNNVYSYMLD